MKRHLIFSLLFSTLSLLGFGQTRKYSNEFMSIGVGARALGMANAMSAHVNDVTAGYWNPAGLSFMETDLQFSLMHASYFSGIANYDYGSFAIKLNDNSALGLSAIRFGVDNIPNTLRLIDDNGVICYECVSGFSAIDYGFLLSYSRQLMDDKLSVGGNGKIIHRTVGSFANAWGFGLDLGAQYKAGDFIFGLMAKDITTTFNAWSFHFTDEEQEVLSRNENIIPKSSVEITVPKTILGTSYFWEISEKFKLLTEADLDFSFDGRRNTLIQGDPISIDPHLGLEVGMWDIVFLRSGIGNFQKEVLVTANEDKEITTFQPNIGLGLKFKIIHLDYAFTDIGDNSAASYSHIISVKFDINKQKPGE